MAQSLDGGITQVSKMIVQLKDIGKSSQPKSADESNGGVQRRNPMAHSDGTDYRRTGSASSRRL
ncbi:MAG: hypothetical protein ACK5PZ_05855 [Pirellula sp.]